MSPYHIISRCILPQGGHYNEVSYLDAFVLDSILDRRPVHLSHLIIRHMISSHNVSNHVLPYDCLFSSYSTASISHTSLIDRRLTITTRSPHPPSVVKGYQLQRHSLRLNRRRMRFKGIEVGVDPPDHMEDDLHIPSLQTILLWCTTHQFDLVCTPF